MNARSFNVAYCELEEICSLRMHSCRYLIYYRHDEVDNRDSTKFLIFFIPTDPNFFTQN